MPVEHPLLEQLRRITAAVPTIRESLQSWADAHLLPLLRDIHAATDQPDLNGRRVNQFLRSLRAVLAQRDDTRSLATPPDADGGTPKLIDTGTFPLHAPQLSRVKDEIRGLVDSLLAALGSTPPPVNHASEPRNPLLTELDSYGTLAKGWNGYSAAAPTAIAIENARGLVTEASASETSPVRVAPSAMGGVGVTFASGDREVIVEFYNNGTAHALFADSSNEQLDTQPVAPGTEGYRKLLQEVSKYINGH